MIDGPPSWWSTRYESAVGWCWSSWLRTRRGKASQRGVRPVGVVLDPPGLDQDLGFGQAGAELLDVEEFVADAAVEATRQRGSPRARRVDVGWCRVPAKRHQSPVPRRSARGRCPCAGAPGRHDGDQPAGRRPCHRRCTRGRPASRGLRGCARRRRGHLSRGRQRSGRTGSRSPTPGRAARPAAARPARSRPAALAGPGGRRKPSSRHKRWMLAVHAVQACPSLGAAPARPSANPTVDAPRRSDAAARSAASSPGRPARAPLRRAMLPATRHARRWDTPNRGPAGAPRPCGAAPGSEVSLGQLLEHVDVQGPWSATNRLSRALKVSSSRSRLACTRLHRMKASAAKRLRELEAENARLKRLVANQALDIDMLKELAEGNF